MGAVRQAEVGVGRRVGGRTFTVQTRQILVFTEVQVAVAVSSGTHHQDLMDHPLHRTQPLLPQVASVGASQGCNASLSITFQVRPFLHDLTHLSVILSQTVDLIGDFSPCLLLGVS